MPDHESLTTPRWTLEQGLLRFSESCCVLDGGHCAPAPPTGATARALLSPCTPDRLGSRGFCRTFGLAAPYVAGSMAKGISAVGLVQVLAAEGLLAFYGAGGQDPTTIAAAIAQLKDTLPDRTWGINLISSPMEPRLEETTVRLLLDQQVSLVEAAAYMEISLPLVRYRTAGIHCSADGSVTAPNRIMAKVSREEIAALFCSPPPAKHLAKLVATGELTEEQAQLAARIPMADALTAEADSGGHTDNRPLPALLPTIRAARDRALAEHGLSQTIHLGAAGGLGTPEALACAFSLGADYVVTGSVNQGCVEAGTSDRVRQLLAEVRQGDVAMAPAADMFEMGGRVQVIKRGTMFAQRAGKLFELYRSYPSLDALPPAEIARLEKTTFQAPLATVWETTAAYWRQHDPSQLERAERDPKHRMALLFRWYLGMSPHWANGGAADRVLDYQIWCGPAMGAFNAWAAGSHLAAWQERQAADVAWNLLAGACWQLRLLALRLQGVEPPPSLQSFRPRPMHQLKELFAS